MADIRQYMLWARSRQHQARVAESRRILWRAAAHGTIVVSTSWGKDSIALCDLALETLGGLDMLHMASPYELPGYDETVAHFSARGRVHVLDPQRTLEETIAWLGEVGLGHERETAHGRRVAHRAKRDRSLEWCAERGFRVQALGMRIAEGGPRARLLRNKGAVYARADGTVVACPIAHWDALDVWARIFSRELPYNRCLYDAETHGLTRETIRNTGWLTTIDAPNGRIAWLRQHFPENYAMLVEAFPRIAAYR